VALGPFTTYVPPGVYTRTLTETNAANLLGGLRIPVYIGVGQEELEQPDLELVRGSSSTLDQQIVSEDVSQRFVVDSTNPNNLILGATDGTYTQVKVRNYPIVDGQGFGRTTNSVRSVSVTVDGDPVAVGSVTGSTGLITLQVPPAEGTDIRVTYFFHRGDTAFTDTVSDQVTVEQAVLTTPGYATFDVTASVTDTFTLTVDEVEYTMTFVAGSYSAAGLKALIDAQGITGLVTSVYTDEQARDHVRFTAAKTIVIGDGNANGVLGFATGTATNRNRVFRVFQRPIVDGTDGGITTTDPTKVTVLVNGVQVVASAVDGTNGLVTLPEAPASSSTVTIGYWANTWQDTFDYLPNTLVTSVTRCGFSPGRSDYIEDTDFVISNPSPDVSIIHWGSSYVVASASRTAGATVFDDTQIIPTLVDDKIYLAECERVVDSTIVPAVTSTNQFTLPQVPTLGNGRDTPLGTSVYNAVSNNRVGLQTNRPDLVIVYTGRDLNDALGRNAVVVTQVESSTRVITLKDDVPPDHLAFATFWYSRLSDDTYIFTNKVPGSVGTGQYEVYSTTFATNLHQCRFGVKTGLPETVEWPRGVENVPDAFHTGAGTPVAETLTVTFDSDGASNAVYTNEGAGAYSFFAGASDFWRTDVNGTSYVTDLDTAVRGFLVGSRIALTAGALTAIITAAVNDTFSITVDGSPNDIDVTLVTGLPNPTPANIVTDINAAIDAADFSGVGGIDFTATAPNALAQAVVIGTTGAWLIIESLTVPAALPGGFDHASTIAVRQGTAETALGFTTFQSASGTSTATTKPATLLGTNAGTFIITAGVDDQLDIRVNGTDYQVSIPSGAAVTTAAIAAAIVAVPGLAGVATVGTLGNLDQLRLTSPTFDAGSSVETLASSTALTILGFTAGERASWTQVDPQEVINGLLTTAGFVTDGVAYVTTEGTDEYITIESIATGVTTSTIAFVTGTTSAFIAGTGTAIEVGTSGDNGEDASDIYTVTSSNANGSAGTGIPGQTYTDATTGLRFTILPSATGSYTATGNFTMVVSPTFTVNPAIPWLSIGGLEVIVTDTVGVGVEDTATVQTFDPSGLEPAIGDFYFITYDYMKQDFSTRLFQQFKTIEANFGPISAENRVTLASYLAIINGAVLVGIKQVLKEPNTNQASAASFIEAIGDLATPLPGNVRPDILIPLSTDTSVYSFLLQHCETQSNIRNQGERLGFIGFASGTTPTSAQTIAKSLQSNRIIACYPDSAVITLQNELGETFETLVDGTFIASALAGAVVSPAVDVATPYTRRQVQGFTRLPRILDPIESNQTAIAGLTLFEDLDPIVRVRQGLTTDMASVLTRLPTVTQISDHVQQQSRSALDTFVGTKFLSSRTNEVEVSMTSLFKDLVQAEIVGAFTGIAAEVDSDDPTILRFEAFYQPIFPLLYLVLTFNLRARI
jgi:hypothetical protein